MTEEWMDTKEIADLEIDDTRDKRKDQRVLHQQRSVIMNKQQCIDNFFFFFFLRTIIIEIIKIACENYNNSVMKEQKETD